MPTTYQREFRRNAVAVALRGDQTRTVVARRFGIYVSCLTRWLTIADRDGGSASAVPPAVPAVRRCWIRLGSVSCWVCPPFTSPAPMHPGR